VKALKTEHPALLILVYSAFEETIFAERALRSGADGYVMKKRQRKNCSPPFAKFWAAAFMSAGTWRCGRSKDRWSRNRTIVWADPVSGIERLSDREMHIFQLVGSGLRNRQIAHSLNLSVKTIQRPSREYQTQPRPEFRPDLVECATKYIEENFWPPKKDSLPDREEETRAFPCRLTVRTMSGNQSTNSIVGLDQSQ
jgi:hypothetical protein